MYSDRNSPEIPVFGNKVIAVMGGLLEIHGVPRTPTWTMLSQTANIGDTSITLIAPVDWQVGESIIIAATGYYNYEAEQMTIVSIDRTNPSNPVLTLNSPLLFKHFSGIQYFDDDFIEMRAEVGLLTRNVLYRGDPETSSLHEFGAHIMVHGDSMGSMSSMIARIEYLELFDVG